ncbi:hypothetical protein FNV43_RR00203 [Rhamnella rubrinervis]|uniref:Uncharacterized protein n=1 Tax=Rhamnella rubrinervis TaxID=2594499 RepID=A0A8K0MS65_9ROSA|nr:hypothetical protein FNV43_RR00203 [Rhamnella rubrinervis]
MSLRLPGPGFCSSLPIAMIAEVFLGSHAASSPSLPGSSPVSLFRLLTIRRARASCLRFMMREMQQLMISTRNAGGSMAKAHKLSGKRLTFYYVWRIQIFGLKAKNTSIKLADELPNVAFNHVGVGERDEKTYPHLEGLSIRVPLAELTGNVSQVACFMVLLIPTFKTKDDVSSAVFFYALVFLNNLRKASLCNICPGPNGVWPALTPVELVDLEGVVDLLLLDQQVESPLVLTPLAQRFPTPRSETELDDLSWLTKGASVREEQFVLSDSELKVEGARMVASSNILAGAEGDNVVMVDAFAPISPKPVNYELKDLLSNIYEESVEQLRHFYEIPQNVTFRRPKKRGETPGWERGGNHSAFSLSGGKPARGFPRKWLLISGD